MSKKKPVYIWMKVTLDEYEFPLAVAESAAKLAQMCGVTEGAVSSGVYHEKQGLCRSRFKKVRVA